MTALACVTDKIWEIQKKIKGVLSDRGNGSTRSGPDRSVPLHGIVSSRRWAREAVERLVHGSAAEAGAGRDSQSDRDLTLGWVSAYESAVCKEKKEISGEPLQDFTGSRRSVCATLVSS
jgi:hypothetical protein